MKNFKLFLITIALATFTISCEDDGGTSNFVSLDLGAVPNMTKSSSTDAFYNLIKLNNGENVSVTFNAEVAQGDPASADVVGIYTTASGAVYSSTIFSNVTLPQEFNLSVNDIIAAFSELNDPSDIQVGDNIALTTRFTMNDGTVLNILNNDGTSGTGANIQTTVLFTTVINYPVSCPSDLGGVYDVISNGENTAGIPPAVDFPYTITLTDNGGGSYTMSDFAAGVYILWYTGFGLTFEQPGTFTDVCGTIGGDFTDAWGQTVPVTGSVNEDGTIDLRWDNPWGDFNDSILTPQ